MTPPPSFSVVNMYICLVLLAAHSRVMPALLQCDCVRSSRAEGCTTQEKKLKRRKSKDVEESMLGVHSMDKIPTDERGERKRKE